MGRKSQNRILELQHLGLYKRLLEGASILGTLHNGGQRCETGKWSVSCSCAPMTPFCKAKARWLAIFNEWSPEHLNDLDNLSPFYLIEAMTVGMLEKLNVTITLSLPTGQKIKVGPEGTSWKTFEDLSVIENLSEMESATNSVLKVMEKFEPDPKKEKGP